MSDGKESASESVAQWAKIKVYRKTRKEKLNEKKTIKNITQCETHINNK